MVAVYAKTDLIQDLIRYVETTQSHLGGCPSAVVASRGDSVVLERYSSGVSARLGEVGADTYPAGASSPSPDSADDAAAFRVNGTLGYPGTPAGLSFGQAGFAPAG